MFLPFLLENVVGLSLEKNFMRNMELGNCGKRRKKKDNNTENRILANNKQKHYQHAGVLWENIRGVIGRKQVKEFRDLSY